MVIATHDSGLVDALKVRVVTLEDGIVVRDSTGGYKKPTAKKEEIEPEIIEEKPTKKTPNKTESDDQKKRKVRITAIRS